MWKYVQSGKMVMMITPLTTDYKKGKRVNKNEGFWKDREGGRLRKIETILERKTAGNSGDKRRKVELD